jgi:hypothetical protein
MIVGAIGRCFRAVARLRPGEPGRDLDLVGAELVRLERRIPQRPATSR